MRLHTENTETFAHVLAASLHKDPASLEQWRCVHIGHGDRVCADYRGIVLQAIKETHHDLDCDAVLCNDGDVLFIGRADDRTRLQVIADEFINALWFTEDGSVRPELYDVAKQWKTVRELLLSKTGDVPPPPRRSAPRYLGETFALQDVFSEARKLRKARMPLHIMLVEDDPLTRHIVTGAFKENYALITSVNAQEAVANYLLHAPDVVFLDIGLPDASGFDVLQHIVACDPDAYVVMFSANSYLDNVTQALSQGASGFVPKPFKKDRLHSYVRSSAQHHRKHYA